MPLISGVSGSFQQAWKQQYDKTSSSYSYSKVENDYSLSQDSGLDDTVWYQSNDFYVYLYPVLGKTVCPPDIPGCDASQAQPLYVSFSGPTDSVISPLDGATTEWYQPVHEEGQIFSYPWDLSQLKARFPESSVMSTNDIILTTDSSPPIQRSVQWITDTSAQTSTQNTYTHSFSSSNSITVGGIDDDEGGAELSGSFDYNSSAAISTLNTSSTDIGAYTEISLTRPSFPDGSLYKYSFEPLVISQGAPTGTVQIIGAPATTYTATGTIAAEYVMRPPTDPQFTWGDWWSQAQNWYTQNIDIALNHPNRWNDSAATGRATECYAGQCIQPYLPQLVAFGAAADEPYISQWHHMRGLLVTVGTAGGPQRVSAQVGDEIYLQARVYNYSLKAMAPDSQIVVQFYRQQYEDAALVDDTAVLIGETALGPLPGYGNSNLIPNWTTATTSFTATSDLEDTNQVFWVLVWAVDENGDMVAEVPDHGLTEAPGALTSIVDVPIEPGPQVATSTGTGTTSFSNNVGLYHRPFCIGTCENTTAAPQNPPVLTLSSPHVTPLGNQRSRLFLISAEIGASNGGAEGVLVSLIREVGGKDKVLDMDILPFVAEDNSQVVRIPFRPDSCGAEHLLLEVKSANAGPAVQPVTVNTDCPTYLPMILLGQ